MSSVSSCAGLARPIEASLSPKRRGSRRDSGWSGRSAWPSTKSARWSTPRIRSCSPAVWDLSEPPPVLGGSFVDVPLKHNTLVYDAARNVYYASVPGSVASSGNRIATIDPATGQLSFSRTVGPEPGALAISADASALYVGLDGTRDPAK